jgi:hypothetical protein
MKFQTRMRLFFLLVLLAVVAFVMATPAQQTAYAAPCCSWCDLRLEACYAGTQIPSCQGDPACCEAALASCFHTCNGAC